MTGASPGLEVDVTRTDPPPDAVSRARARLDAGDPRGAGSTLAAALRRGAPGLDRQAAARVLAAAARSAADRGEVATAERSLVLALTLVDWADLHHALGVLRARRGDIAGARASLDRALAINPRYRTAALDRAMIEAREGRIAAALELLSEAVGGEGAAGARLREGLARLGAAAIDDAEVLLREALAEPGGLETQVAGALERFEAGDRGGALATFRALAERHPGYADLQALLGAHELRCGLVDDGIASLVRALGIHPGFHAARVELARGLYARGESGRALGELRAILEHAPSHGDAAALLGEWTSRRGAPSPDSRTRPEQP